MEYGFGFLAYEKESVLQYSTHFQIFFRRMVYFEQIVLLVLILKNLSIWEHYEKKHKNIKFV